MLSKRNLARDIIRDQFGEVVERVSAILILRGKKTIAELMEESKLPFLQVRNSLITLVHQNMCTFFTLSPKKKDDEFPTVGSGKKKQQQASAAITSKLAIQIGGEQQQQQQQRSDGAEEPEEERTYYYAIDIENVLMRMRFPMFLWTTRCEYGEEAEILLEELLKHGRLTTEDLLKKVSLRFGDIGDGGSAIGGFRSTFSQMVKHRLVIRVIDREDTKKAGDKVTSQQDAQLLKGPETTSTAGKSKKTSSSAASASTATKATKKKGTTATKPDGKKKRKRGETSDDDEPNEGGEEAESAGKKKRESEPFATDDTMETDEQQQEQQYEQEITNILWRVNYEQFIRKFIHKEIINYTKQKINPAYGNIMEAILRHTGAYEKTTKDEVSAVITLEQIHDALHEDASLSQETLLSNLENMSRVKILQRMGFTHGGTFTVNLGLIKGIIKQKQIESIIQQKFGKIGARIVRMLLMKKQLEQKQIADFAMVPAKDAREVLYKMLASNIVQLQEVPRSVDHLPARTFYLWTVNLQRVYEALSEDMYKTCRNLNMRLKKEQTDTFAAIGGNANVNVVSESQSAQLERMKKAEDRLNSSLIRLNETIIFLEYF